jgi:predicted nucleotidyltransferase component of viral defense system
VTKHDPLNLAASVHARLLNLAKAEGRSFNDVLQLHAMERFLHRLAASPHADRFMLKGAMLLRAWNPRSYRPTRDIDLLGRIPDDIPLIIETLAAICDQPVQPDGLIFDASSLRGESIIEGGSHKGIRVTFRGTLGRAIADMQIDIGFGDAVTPAPERIEYPTLLDFPAPRLMAYRAETTIAEKFEVMLKRGEANSRMKDYHDLWWLAHAKRFDGEVLRLAIKATCEHRGIVIQERPFGLSPEFGQLAAKTAQWKAFRRRLDPTDCPADLPAVVDCIRAFLEPVIASISQARAFPQHWEPRGPWR